MVNFLGATLLFDINELWWNISKALFAIVDGIQKAFFFIAGIEDTGGSGGANADTPSTGFGNLLMDVFTAGGQIKQMYIYMLLPAVLIFSTCILIGVIKIMGAHKKDEIGSSLGKLGTKGLTAVFFLVITPIIFFAAIEGTGALLEGLVRAFRDVLGTDMPNSNGSLSLSQILHEICMPEGIVVKEGWTAGYDKLKDAVANESYSYLMAILGSGFLIVVLVIACITLVKRFIDIFALYIEAPLVIAKMPLDDGQSFSLWKDKVMVKFLMVAGMIISMMLFFIIVPQVIAIANKIISNDRKYLVIMNFVKILFVIGTAKAASEGGTQIADLISTSAGQSEAASQAQSARTVSAAVHTAAAVGSKIVGGAMISGNAGMMGMGGMATQVLSQGVGSALPAGAAAMGLSGAGGSGGSATVPASGTGSSGGKAAAAKLAGKGGAKMGGMGMNYAIMSGGIGGMVGYAAGKLMGGIGKLVGKGASALGKAIGKPVGKAAKAVGSKINSGIINPIRQSATNANARRRAKADENYEKKHGMTRAQAKEDKASKKLQKKYGLPTDGSAATATTARSMNELNAQQAKAIKGGKRNGKIAEREAEYKKNIEAREAQRLERQNDSIFGKPVEGKENKNALEKLAEQKVQNSKNFASDLMAGKIKGSENMSEEQKKAAIGAYNQEMMDQIERAARMSNGRLRINDQNLMNEINQMSGRSTNEANGGATQPTGGAQ